MIVNDDFLSFHEFWSAKPTWLCYLNAIHSLFNDIDIAYFSNHYLTDRRAIAIEYSVLVAFDKGTCLIVPEIKFQLEYYNEFSGENKSLIYPACSIWHPVGKER